MKINLAVLVSGRGSNLEAIAKAIKNKQLTSEIKIVIINNKHAMAVEVCKIYNLPYAIIENKNLSRLEHEKMVINEIKKHNCQLIVLAGYMRVLTKNFLEEFKNKTGKFYQVVNIHPSLIPAFTGRNAYEQAFNYGVKISGITVHLVNEEIDGGAILAQECFRISPNDSLDDVKAKGLKIEHELYPQTLQNIITNGIQIGTYTFLIS